MVDGKVAPKEPSLVALLVVMLVAAKVETKADELVRVKAACWADAMVVLENSNSN